MFFEPYKNDTAGVVCRDGGLKQNNPVERAFNEAKAIWGRDAKFDTILSIGSGRSRFSPEKPASIFIIPDWLTSLFDNFMTTFNGQDQWDSFYRVVEESVKVRSKRLNIRFDNDTEPALDDIGSMASMKRSAEDFSFHNIDPLSLIHPATEDLLEEIALQLRAGLFFFHPTSIEFNKNRSVAIIAGAICCRLDPKTVPFRELVALSEGFEVPGQFVSIPPYEDCQPKFMFQHDMESADQQVQLRAKFKDGRFVPISGSPIAFKVSIISCFPPRLLPHLTSGNRASKS